MSKLKVGAEVPFKGYAKLEDGQKPIFTKGEIIVITKVVDDETYEAKSKKDGKKHDQVFADEVTIPGDKTDSKAKAPAATTAPKATEKAAAPKTAPKLVKGSKPAPAKAPAKVEEKGKAKAKDEKKPAAAKKEAPKAPPVEELPVLPPESYSESVQKVTKSDGAALKAAKGLVEKIGENFWMLGGILSHIRRHKSYQILKDDKDVALYDGPKGFDRYVESELGLAYRKAMYYIDIHEKFAPLGIDETRLLGIGWSKVKELTNVVNAKNVEAWLKKAEKLGREDLQAEITTARVKAGDGSSGVNPSSGETAKVTRFKFAAFEDQGTMVLEALKQAKEACGGDDNAAFVHIVSEWLSLNSGDAGSISIDDAFKTLENRYGVADLQTYIKKQYKK